MPNHGCEAGRRDHQALGRPQSQPEDWAEYVLLTAQLRTSETRSHSNQDRANQALLAHVDQQPSELPKQRLSAELGHEKGESMEQGAKE